MLRAQLSHTARQHAAAWATLPARGPPVVRKVDGSVKGEGIKTRIKGASYRAHFSPSLFNLTPTWHLQAA